MAAQSFQGCKTVPMSGGRGLRSALSRPTGRGPVAARPVVALATNQKATASEIQDGSMLQRRALLLSQAVALAGATGLAATRPARAESATAVEAPAAGSSSSTSSSSSSAAFTPFLDNDYQLTVPSDWTYYETPIEVVERGPQPERSPLRARWEAPDGSASASILTRRAVNIKRTIVQTADLSQWGSEVDVAPLLVPKGARLLASAKIVEPRASRDTPLGPVEIPPRTYYLYEFTTPNGLHVAMSAGAQRGTVYVCGVSAPLDKWDQAKDAAGKVVRSFRLRSALA